jgi:phosphate transport system substrate-binding protein
MTDEELAKARGIGGEVLHIPLVMGAVVPVYNLPDVKETLRFTGPVLGEIFLGNIKRWDDPKIQKLQEAHVKLPPKDIVVVHRRDESGTTYIWTDYLSKVSPQWKEKVGKGHDIKWPTGEAEVGNDRLAEAVKNQPFAIGYVELVYAHRKEIAFGSVQNREGEWVKASLQTTTTTANNSMGKLPEDLRFSITDALGAGSYPICGTTWAIVYANQPAGQGRDLAKFLAWVLDEGQARCEDLFYARLPEALATKAKQKVQQIQGAKSS